MARIGYVAGDCIQNQSSVLKHHTIDFVALFPSRGLKLLGVFLSIRRQVGLGLVPSNAAKFFKPLSFLARGGHLEGSAGRSAGSLLPRGE